MSSLGLPPSYIENRASGVRVNVGRHPARANQHLRIESGKKFPTRRRDGFGQKCDQHRCIVVPN
jgi:hypothetical protein